MKRFRLTYRPLGTGPAVDRLLQAPSLDQAYAVAGDIIAEAHGMTGEHVSFDRFAQRVSIGAGYRSRRGTFTLEEEIEPRA